MSKNMYAAVLKKIGDPLVVEVVPKPVCQKKELLVKVEACGVCRTDLHILDGDLPEPKLPLILGHEIVGIVEGIGSGVSRFKIGDRVGIPWLAQSCGVCFYCQSKRENLCDQAQFTGYHRNGGFAQYTTCHADFAIPLPLHNHCEDLAPLLCAGLIGYRSYMQAHPEKKVGFYGFGVAAHLLIQLAVGLGKEVYAFTKKGDVEGQAFALRLGAVWAGDSTMAPPDLLDSAIIFAPVGELVPLSLKVLKKGGRCVCGGIHMSDIPSFPYRDLWGEKTIQSVANLTRQDAIDYFQLLGKIPVKPNITVYPLDRITQALQDLRQGNLLGAAVIRL
jgi:propanol-preferring alcohol dehydrogenase